MHHYNVQPIYISLTWWFSMKKSKHVVYSCFNLNVICDQIFHCYLCNLIEVKSVRKQKGIPFYVTARFWLLDSRFFVALTYSPFSGFLRWHLRYNAAVSLQLSVFRVSLLGLVFWQGKCWLLPRLLIGPLLKLAPTQTRNFFFYDHKGLIKTFWAKFRNHTAACTRVWVYVCYVWETLESAWLCCGYAWTHEEKRKHTHKCMCMHIMKTTVHMLENHRNM